MTDDYRNRLQQLAGVLSLLAVVAALAILGGFPGIIFGLAVVITWLAAPPVFAFVIAQAGLAAFSTPTGSSRFVAAEIAVVALLLSDRQLSVTLRTHGVAICYISLVAGAVWLLQPASIWVGAIVSLAGVAVALYTGHRYELLATGQLE